MIKYLRYNIGVAVTEVFFMTEGKKELIRTIKFTLFSISAGIIQTISFELFDKLIRSDYWISYLVSLVLSVVWNFTLNRKFTFYSAGSVPVAMLKVVVFYLAFTPLSTLAGHWLTGEGIGWNNDLVFVGTMFSNFVLEYLYDRFIVFKKTIDTAKKDS